MTQNLVLTPCLFTSVDEYGEIDSISSIYVDNSLIGGPEHKIELIKGEIKKRFPIKDLGEAKHVVGMQVECIQAADNAECSWQAARLFKLQFQPDIIYVSSRCDPDLIDLLREPFEDLSTDEDGVSKSPAIRLEKATSFSTEMVRSIWSP